LADLGGRQEIDLDAQPAAVLGGKRRRHEIGAGQDVVVW
jgi:hypothetical protein